MVNFIHSTLLSLLLRLAHCHTVITYPGWRGDNLAANGSIDDTNGLGTGRSGAQDIYPYGMQWIYPCKCLPAIHSVSNALRTLTMDRRRRYAHHFQPYPMACSRRGDSFPTWLVYGTRTCLDLCQYRLWQCPDQLLDPTAVTLCDHWALEQSVSRHGVSTASSNPRWTWSDCRWQCDDSNCGGCGTWRRDV